MLLKKKVEPRRALPFDDIEDITPGVCDAIPRRAAGLDDPVFQRGVSKVVAGVAASISAVSMVLIGAGFVNHSDLDAVPNPAPSASSPVVSESPRVDREDVVDDQINADDDFFTSTDSLTKDDADAPVFSASISKTDSLPKPESVKSAAGVEKDRRKYSGGDAGKVMVSDAPFRAGDGKIASPVSGRIAYSSPFGWRIHPIKGTRSFHTGVDFARSCGTKTSAVAPGVVTFAGWHGSAYGYRVEVRHSEDLVTTYSHLSRVGVRVGDKVSTGSTVGFVGTTGLSTGCHLHFETVYKGNWVNPDDWFRGRGGSGGVSARMINFAKRQNGSAASSSPSVSSSSNASSSGAQKPKNTPSSPKQSITPSGKPSVKNSDVSKTPSEKPSTVTEKPKTPKPSVKPTKPSKKPSKKPSVKPSPSVQPSKPVETTKPEPSPSDPKEQKDPEPPTPAKTEDE